MSSSARRNIHKVSPFETAEPLGAKLPDQRQRAAASEKTAQTWFSPAQPPASELPKLGTFSDDEDEDTAATTSTHHEKPYPEPFLPPFSRQPHPISLRTTEENSFDWQRLRTTYNPLSPPPDDATTAEGVRLGVVADASDRRWREQVMRLGRWTASGHTAYISGHWGPPEPCDLDELRAVERRALDIEFRRAPVIARRPVKGGKGRRCTGAYWAGRNRVLPWQVENRRTSQKVAGVVRRHVEVATEDVVMADDDDLFVDDEHEDLTLSRPLRSELKRAPKPRVLSSQDKINTRTRTQTTPQTAQSRKRERPGSFSAAVDQLSPFGTSRSNEDHDTPMAKTITQPAPSGGTIGDGLSASSPSTPASRRAQMGTVLGTKTSAADSAQQQRHSTVTVVGASAASEHSRVPVQSPVGRDSRTVLEQEPRPRTQARIDLEFNPVRASMVDKQSQRQRQHRDQQQPLLPVAQQSDHPTKGEKGGRRGDQTWNPSHGIIFGAPPKRGRRTTTNTLAQVASPIPPNITSMNDPNTSDDDDNDGYVTAATTSSRTQPPAVAPLIPRPGSPLYTATANNLSHLFEEQIRHAGEALPSTLTHPGGDPTRPLTRDVTGLPSLGVDGIQSFSDSWEEEDEGWSRGGIAAAGGGPGANLTVAAPQSPSGRSVHSSDAEGTDRSWPNEQADADGLEWFAPEYILPTHRPVGAGPASGRRVAVLENALDRKKGGQGSSLSTQDKTSTRGGSRGRYGGNSKSSRPTVAAKAALVGGSGAEVMAREKRNGCWGIEDAEWDCVYAALREKRFGQRAIEVPR
ncbi:hypothetical protein M406DRAFT_333763 [Cryphonectria parasitica EP155]|uniref:Uncharacterized protein n=1 Tax=Cryphonectria parasitica (strain ATCC 38755 / EP155) TaxID=660469 RepID=A0A9P4XVJ5_CRYP1|nr:uncharacterized protein M406DRAFT_333763 [Cryphonectria parasitica EP155]KAF3761708.1 hypothetical protein M406DRAFT_333763 [Cryphonectria parasitica EP155]